MYYHGLLLPHNNIIKPAPHSHSQIITDGHYQAELFLPPSFKRPRSPPHLVIRTLHHNPSLATSNLQHHFPNKAKLIKLSQPPNT